MSQTYTHWAPFLQYGSAWTATAEAHSITRQGQGLEGTLTIPFYGIGVSVGGNVAGGGGVSGPSTGQGATLSLQDASDRRQGCGMGTLNCGDLNITTLGSYTALFAPPSNGAITTVNGVTITSQMLADASVESGNVPNVVVNPLRRDGDIDPFFGGGRSGWTADKTNNAVSGTNGATLELVIPPNVGYIVLSSTFGPQNGELRITSSPDLPWVPNNGAFQTQTTSGSTFSTQLFAVGVVYSFRALVDMASPHLTPPRTTRFPSRLPSELELQA